MENSSTVGASVRRSWLACYVILMGRYREDIMEQCPEGFEDELKGFIDLVEGEVNTAKDHMEINSITDLARLDEAHDMLCALSESLY
jgi:hypothetical protein